MVETQDKLLSSIKGKVFDERHRRVGGAVVQCDEFVKSTLFDGSYNFDSLEIGSHILKVKVEGYKTINKEVEVGEGELQEIDFSLDPETGELKIFGYVFDSKTSKPIKEGGRIHMFKSTYNTSVSINPLTGYYEFIDLPAGTYRIGTSILDYRDEEKIVTVQEGEERSENFICVKRDDLEPPWG